MALLVAQMRYWLHRLPLGQGAYAMALLVAQMRCWLHRLPLGQGLSTEHCPAQQQ